MDWITEPTKQLLNNNLGGWLWDIDHYIVPED